MLKPLRSKKASGKRSLFPRPGQGGCRELGLLFTEATTSFGQNRCAPKKGVTLYFFLVLFALCVLFCPARKFFCRGNGSAPAKLYEAFLEESKEVEVQPSCGYLLADKPAPVFVQAKG